MVEAMNREEFTAAVAAALAGITNDVIFIGRPVALAEMIVQSVWFEYGADDEAVWTEDDVIEYLSAAGFDPC